MSKITDKVRQTIKDAKSTIAGDDSNAGGISSEARTTDPLNEYESKEPMTPAKIKEHEPTAVKREMTENITEPGQTAIHQEEAAERARRSGMTKGTADASETGSEYG